MVPPPSKQLLAEYQSLTADCGLVDLDGWSSISIRGDDRIRFIHNMCTNDVCRLAIGDGCETFFTDVKGKIVAHGFALALKEELLLLTSPQQAATIVTHLERYIIREDVQLQDHSNTYGWFLVSGAEAPQQLAASTDFDPAQLITPWQHARCTLHAAEVLVVRFKAIWPESFLIRYSRSEKSHLLAQLPASTDAACYSSAWTALRIESALPLWGVDFDQTNLPQEVNRDDHAISFNKGCYLGQETIARIDAIGHVNQHLVSLRFSDREIPPAGTRLLSGDKEVGEVTSSCWSPRLEAPLALAMVRRGSNAPDCLLQSKFGPAKVLNRSL